MAKSISIAKQCPAQGSPTGRRPIPAPHPGRSVICARSARKCANSDQAAQTYCQPAAHRQDMTKSISTSCVICFILALLTVLSIVPVLLLLWACDFSPSCLA
jgi:hypothetical protein